MGLRLPPTVGKLLYALLFNGALPLLLWLWARGAEANVSAPAVHAPTVGACLLGVGGALVLAGMVSIRLLGEGLPMNPWPPAKFVARGVYALLAHPIYFGFTLGCGGLALIWGSAAGLWLVTPAMGLAATALVLGYEGPDLVKRFGPRTRAVLLHLPLEGAARPTLAERLGAAAVILGSLGVTGLALIGLGLCLPAAQAPAWPHAVPLLALGVGLATARSRSALRDGVVRTWISLTLVALVVIAGPGGPWGGVLEVSVERLLLTLAGLSALSTLPLLGVGAVACLVTVRFAQGASLSELALAGAAVAIARWRHPLWSVVRAGAQWVGNSWRDWRVGPVRIINHGLLGALGCGAGVLYLTMLLGPQHGWVVLGASMAAIVGSALWAQLIEGSPALARPYGFFGGLLGVVVFALTVAPLSGTPTWLLLGGCTTAAPIIQGLGRLRCVANGCCHGAPCAPWLGLVYHHPMSRPVRLAQLAGVPIHPTQLYSAACCLAAAAVLARLWASHASLSFIAGAYLVLMGLARFIEEAWRGEPQTPSHFGLRLYQWVAMGCVLVGAGLTCLTGTAIAPPPAPSALGGWVTLIFVAVTWVVLSVDFPESKGRFARLA